MNTDRSRGNGGPPRGPARPPSVDEPDATAGNSPFGNLGVLIQQALREQKSAPPATEAVEPEEMPPPIKPCAECWHAKVFRRDGVAMARCALDLWVKPIIPNKDLNSNDVRRWYADCPEYDDSE